ncbi:MAG: hypothetical protein GY777_14960 [Candidatus Brocadiaceae bacterium]|nr:hypothetical protein [Candidatus Brocadiaceae bacterium]
MQTSQKDIVYGYMFKVVLALILLFCLYNVFCILFLSPHNSKKLKSRISHTVDAIEFNIKHAGPINTTKTMYKSNLTSKTKGSPWANQIKRISVFAGPVKLNIKKTEPKKVEKETILNEKVELAANTEIIYKGLADNLAYICVRKEMDGQWHECGFPTKAGERIGRKKTLGSEALDFTTNYVLQEIVHSIQRPIKLMRSSVILDDDGEFVETRMVEGGSFFKTTSKIMYKDNDGNTKELWLGDSAKIVSSGLSKNN